MDLTFFTLASRNYLSFAATLMQSLRAAYPEARRVIGLVDAPELEAAAGLDLAAEVLPWDELAIEGAEAMRLRYSILELNTAIKPFLFQHLLAGGAGGPVIYLDPDIAVYRRLGELEQLLARGRGPGAHAAHHHAARRRSARRRLRSGRAGAASLGRLQPGLPGRRARRAERPAPGVVGRTAARALPGRAPNPACSWINAGWTSARRSTKRHEFSDHPGYNVAYWNLHERALEAPGEAPDHDAPWRVNGEPLAFFHFSGVVPGDPTVFSKHQNRFKPADLGPARALFEDYLRRLTDNGWDQISKIPYAYGRLPNGRPLHGLLRRAYDQAAPAELEQQVDQADPAFWSRRP